ncbi:MAG: TonB-dependent receptor domain-containing protein [Acidobacteriota bacterium]
MNPISKNKFVFTVLLAVMLGSVAWAQTATGTVDGTAKDASGAVIPGVEVSITNTGTGSVRSTITDGSGRFRVTNIPSGDYRAEAKLTGFKTAVGEFKLDVAGLQTLNFVLEVGEVTTVLEVTDVAQKVNTEEGRMSSVVSGRQVVDLPLNGRNIYQLAILQPGITSGRGSGIGGANGTGGSINASGNRSRGNNFSLDGVSNNDPVSGGVATVSPNPDMVAEFRIQNNNFSAEYGRNNGAIINVITKSGSNDFHGSAWWFHRNDALDARETFDTDIAPLRRHQGGFSIGGPIIKNKTFFFLGFEGERDFRGESSTARFETPELRQLVRDQFPGSLADQLFQAFPGRQITDPASITDFGSPNGVFGAVFFGATGAPDGIPDTGLGSFAADQLFKRYDYNYRVDHEISDNNKLFGRWVSSDQSQPCNAARGPANCDSFDGYFANAIFSDTHIFSATLVNEFRFGYNRNRGDFVVEREDIPDINIFAAGTGNITGFGAFGGTPQLFTAEEYNLVDVVSINQGDHGIKAGFEYRWNQDDSDFQFLTRGYVGYAGVFDFISNLPYEITVRVDPNVTGGSLPLLGTPRNFRDSEFAFFFQDDWKVSDRLTLNLGVRYDNYGQISEEQGRLANIKLGSGADVFERIAFATVGRVDSDGIFGRDNNNFSPRIGFAYDLFGDGKTSLRGGYGIAYDRLFLNVTGNIRFNPPDSANLSLYPFQLGIGSPQDLSEFISAQVSVPFPTSLAIPGVTGAGFSPGGTPQLSIDFQGAQVIQTVGGSLRSPDPSLRTSYSQNWFLGIQREMPWDMLFEANYVGNVGRKLGFIEQFNRFNGARFGVPNPFGNPGVRLNPFFTSENLRTNDINSSHNGGNLSVTKRFSQGLAFQSAFTFGKTLDFNSDNFGSNAGGIFTPDPRLKAQEYGLAGFHVGSRWVSNFIWELPFLKNQQGFLGELAGGWQVQGILSFQSGTPYTPRARSSGFDFNGDFRSHDRLDAPSGGTDPFKTPDRNDYRSGVFGTTSSAARAVFNPNGLPGDCDGDGSLGGPAGALEFNGVSCVRQGTLGRSNFFNPGFNQIDFSLFKNFRLPWVGGEDARLQFRAEFFNLFNRTNFNAVQESFTSSQFGRSTSAADAREIQFALKFIF